MRFNPKAKLDTGRINDAGRGRSRGGGLGGGRGGSGIPLPGGAAAGGGGVVALIIAVVAYLVLNGGGGGALDAGRFDAADDTGRYADCKTGEDANNSADCARVAVENSLTDFWGDTLGSDFRPEKRIVTFQGSVGTGCGGASSDVGPFYCPADETIYLDDAFFSDVLQGELGGPSGSFVEPYVLAHEYGHHISYLLGFDDQRSDDTGQESSSVRFELQADCFAGVWAKHATETEDASGNVLLLDLTQQDIDTAIEAAKAVGDDYIQRRAGTEVNPEGWTHGSSEQRKTWFMTGYTQGSVDSCDTFAAKTV